MGDHYSGEIDTEKQEGIDLPSIDGVSPDGVPSAEDVAEAAEKMRDAAEERLAADLAMFYREDETIRDDSAVPSDYKDIVESTNDESVHDKESLAKEVAEKGGYFDYIPGYFEPFTEGSIPALHEMLVGLTKAWETLDQLKNTETMGMMLNDFNREWDGKAVLAIREGFAKPFRTSMHNQQAIIKNLYCDLMSFTKMLMVLRKNAKEIADGATSLLKGEMNDVDSATAFAKLSMVLGFGATVAAPGASAAYFLTVSSGVANAASSHAGDEESGYEDPLEIFEMGDTAFDIVDKALQRLDDLREHIRTAEEAMEAAIQKDMETVESALQEVGYEKDDRARYIRPIAPNVSDVNSQEFVPPGA